MGKRKEKKVTMSFKLLYYLTSKKAWKKIRNKDEDNSQRSRDRGGKRNER